MEAPDPPSSSQAPVAAKSSRGSGVRPLRLPPAVRVSVALVIFLAASLITIFQPPHPDAFRRPRALRSLSWWRYPLEWNAPSRLPKIDCRLNAIYAVPNTSDVWAAGNQAMVVVSRDGGVTWTKRGIERDQIVEPSATPSPSPSPSPTGDPVMSFLGFPDLIPTVSAAEARSELASQRTLQRAPQPTPTVRTERLLSSSTTASRPTATPTPNANTPRTIREESLIAIHFEDVNRGEAFSSLGTRFTTVNSGVNWLEAIEHLRPNFTYVDRSLSNSSFVLGTALPGVGRFSAVSRERMLQWRTLPFRAIETYLDTTDEPTYFAVDEGGNLSTLHGGDSTLAQIGRESLQKINNVSSLRDQVSVSAVSAEGRIFRSNDGKIWKQLSHLPSYDLHGVFFINESRGWIAGSNGAILSTTDGGANWQPQTSGTSTQLNSINFLTDGQHGWIAGNDGLILSTNDGGATWVHRTQGKDATGRYLRFPAPWYFLVLLVTALALKRTKQPAPPPEESVADVLISDRPLDTPSGDVLQFNSIALGLSRFLRNENTMPPLTIAIIGEWGTGKSSLMNLLRADLRSYKFRPVWFNAWHHQKEEHMLASLLENIKLQAVPRWWTSRGLIFRARLLKIRGWRHWLPLLLLVFLIYMMVIIYYHGALHLSCLKEHPDLSCD